MTHDLKLTRVFNASAEQIWKAWSESDYIKQWWGPNGFTAPVADMDFHVGGRSFVCMSSPAFGTLCNTWTYTRIEPMERIEFTLNWADREGNIVNPADVGMPPDFPYEVPHKIMIKELCSGQTELTVAEYGYPSAEIVNQSKAGMEQCLDKMSAIFNDK